MAVARRLIRSAAMITFIAGASKSAFAQTMAWTYTMKIDVDSGDGRARRSSTAMQFISTEHKYRMEFVQATGPLGMIEGTYTIFNDVDTTATMVMPANHMATVSSLSDAVEMAKTGPKRGPTTYTRRETVDLGAGPQILGHATRRFRSSLAGSIEWTMGSTRCVQPLGYEMESWIAPGLELGGEMGSMKNIASMAGLPKDQLSDSAEAKLPKGSSLRVIVKTQHAGDDGAIHSVTTKMEVVELKKGPVDDALFAVPSDYKTMDLRKMLATLPAGMMDSVMRSSAEKNMATLCGSDARSDHSTR
jgi:hypothetical protein